MSMNSRFSVIVVLAGLGFGCGQLPLSPTEQMASGPPPPQAAAAHAASGAAAHAASGTFAQTAVTSIDVRSAGPNTVIEQTSEGTLTGTLAGTFDDDVKVVIHPNGSFTANFTITCVCTVDGKQGVVRMVATDRGQRISPDVASFSGRVVITGASGALTGLGGVLKIEGTVDVPTGLATYDYDGTIRFTP